VIVQAATNHDGRTDAPLIRGRPIPIGRYELRFEIGHDYASREVPTADPPFLQSVPIEFFVAEPEAHYHVPLLVTPWSFSTYRGSLCGPEERGQRFRGPAPPASSATAGLWW
jgi:2-oxo-4-hydroxy-4-carboxy-5-ureidoimidazoline decarboxylase